MNAEDSSISPLDLIQGRLQNLSRLLLRTTYESKLILKETAYTSYKFECENIVICEFKPAMAKIMIKPIKSCCWF